MHDKEGWFLPPVQNPGAIAGASQAVGNRLSLIWHVDSVPTRNTH